MQGSEEPGLTNRVCVGAMLLCPGPVACGAPEVRQNGRGVGGLWFWPKRPPMTRFALWEFMG